ncbi:hypothetical protein BGAL_0166g00120 [Botrytis galanthina]|uniref:Uncharacterized protein n=1 Tax=Botrytis galanthina TaxID=278940 RepID=A0A4S8QYH5_9HELO|nr:hypothetical protein BGAL_0166g00120 [Botrytis galanthina]
MAARHTPGPSVGSSGSTSSSTVSREKNLSDFYVDFDKDCHQLSIQNKKLSDDLKFKSNTSNHDGVPVATPVPSSSARDKLQEVVASLLPAIDEPFFEQFSSLRNEIEGKIRVWDALAAENIKLHTAARIKEGVEDATSASDKSYDDLDRKKTNPDLGRGFQLADVFGHKFGFGAYY